MVEVKERPPTHITCHTYTDLGALLLILVILALERLTCGDCREFKANLVFIVSSMTAQLHSETLTYSLNRLS